MPKKVLEEIKLSAFVEETMALAQVYSTNQKKSASKRFQYMV